MRCKNFHLHIFITLHTGEQGEPDRRNDQKQSPLSAFHTEKQRENYSDQTVVLNLTRWLGTFQPNCSYYPRYLVTFWLHTTRTWDN